MAFELFVAGDLVLPLVERGLPLFVRLEQAGQVPGVGGFDFAARGERFGFEFAHWKSLFGWSNLRRWFLLRRVGGSGVFLPCVEEGAELGDLRGLLAGNVGFLVR